MCLAPLRKGACLARLLLRVEVRIVLRRARLGRTRARPPRVALPGLLLLHRPEQRAERPLVRTHLLAGKQVRMQEAVVTPGTASRFT